MTTSNIFNNRVEITAAALESVKNNTLMASRVARRWDGDWKGSTKIGNTLNVRVPGFYSVRTGAAAVPNGYNDTYVPIVLQQYGVDIELTSAELTLNVDEFKQNVVKPMSIALFQKIDNLIMNTIVGTSTVAGFNQFAGVPGTSITNLTPFKTGSATMEFQGAAPFDGKLSGMLNPYMSANMLGGLATYFNPTKEISEQYRNGSMGNAYGIDFFETANSPTLTLGTWSGTILYASGATDGGNTIVVSGMTGTFNPGEKFTVGGVYAVNPVGHAQTPSLKQFTVVSQTSTTITFSPAMNLTGANQNINALPSGTPAIYPWGNASASLAAGTGQVVQVSFAFHEDAIAFGMGDITDLSGMGGAVSARVKDEQTGLRCRSLFWTDGYNDKVLYRLDVLAGASMLRQGFGSLIVQ